jgi:2-polyprenyl-3-methyl-5-hydroxy-6-metoxy-1,4-benzoquinol methylase
METTTADSRYGSEYWTSESVYRKYHDYATALAELRGFNRGLVRRILRHAPAGRRHVDAGCGHGAIVHELLARGWDSYGFDASAFMIDLARRHSPALAGRFAAGDLLRIPFDGQFDLITCLQVLEHVDDPVVAIRALGERLSPGGRLALTTPNLQVHVPLWPDPLTSDPTHVSVHEPSWWEGAVRAAGLSVLYRSTQMPVPLVWRLHPALGFWIGMGRRIGPDVLIVAGQP